MSEEIEPALTPEQWREVEKGNLDATDMVTAYCEEGVVIIEDDRWHALAALALYDQDFGFTREDLSTLRDAAEYAEVGYKDRKTRDAIMALADRIAKLLPPEPTDA